MSPARVATIEAWLRVAYDQLGMRDYEVEFEPDQPPHEEGLASSWMADHAERVKVRVHSGFWDDSPPERQRNLLHEVLHAPFQRLRQVATEGLDGVLGKEAGGMFDRLFMHETERMVGKLERALAPAFPPVDDPDRPAPSEGPA